MADLEEQVSKSPGYALLVVLSTLSILTLLFAISTRLSLAHVRTQQTEILLAERDALRIALLRATVVRLAEDLALQNFEIVLDGTVHPVRAIPANGLVDLNTASRELLAIYLRAIGLTEDEIRRFSEWRQSGERLSQVEDIIRVSGVDGADIRLLKATATVYSGQTGITRNDAPEALFQLMSGTRIEENPIRSVNFEVFYIEENDSFKLGSVNMGVNARLLE